MSVRGGGRRMTRPGGQYPRSRRGICNGGVMDEGRRTTQASRMRLTPLIVPVCALVTALVSREAAATSCAGPPWSPFHLDGGGSHDRGGPFPVDVVWWEQRSCAFGIERPNGCTLTSFGTTIAVDVELVGEAACTPDSEDHSGFYPEVIIHYIPSEPLAPDTIYTLECESDGPSDVAVVIGAETASPPGSLADAGVQGIRSGDGCCSYGDYIELTLDTEAAYLREGGYIEARYSNGQVLALTLQDDPGVVLMPDTREPLELTPVAADGTRGQTRRFEEVPRELVYVPCTVTERPPPLALWMVAPLLWIGAHGRRRRRAGGAS
jgi:hypothetical protein